MQLFLDMDGVLADFDRHHETVFGFRPCKLADNVDWKAVRAVPRFYEAIPPMADLDVLWGAVAHLNPIVLTGVPSSVEEAPDNKRAWVRRHLGSHVEVRCCRSSEKWRHVMPGRVLGDVLVDDWEKYKNSWLVAGGRWVTHVTAADTVQQLRNIGAL
jgi:hypothetical protein